MRMRIVACKFLLLLPHSLPLSETMIPQSVFIPNRCMPTTSRPAQGPVEYPIYILYVFERQPQLLIVIHDHEYYSFLVFQNNNYAIVIAYRITGYRYCLNIKWKKLKIKKTSAFY